MMALPWGKIRGFPWQLHKNIGLTVVVLVAVLLYMRMRRRACADAGDDSPRWMKRLAAADHALIYVMVVLVGVSGYLSSAFSGWSTTLWWLLPLPNWGREDEELNALFSDVHLVTSWLLLLMIATHVAGALYHAFRPDGIVRRMLHW